MRRYHIAREAELRDKLNDAAVGGPLQTQIHVREQNRELTVFFIMTTTVMIFVWMILLFNFAVVFFPGLFVSCVSREAVPVSNNIRYIRTSCIIIHLHRIIHT